MNEKVLNEHIKNYYEGLKNMPLDKNYNLKNYNKIIEFIKNKNNYLFNKDLLSKESYFFLKQRNIKIQFKTAETDNLKSRVHDFIKSFETKKILSNLKKQKTYEVCGLIEVLENTLIETINCSEFELNKTIKNNLLFAKKKRLLFCQLIETTYPNNLRLLEILKLKEPDIDQLNELYSLIEQALINSKINSLSFLKSISYTKEQRTRINLIT